MASGSLRHGNRQSTGDEIVTENSVVYYELSFHLCEGSLSFWLDLHAIFPKVIKLAGCSNQYPIV